jgi:hypothetical protein
MCTIKHIIPLFYNRRAVKVKDVSYYDPCVDQPQRTCHTPPRRTSDATTNTNLSSPIKFTAHVSEIIYALPLPTSIPPYYAPVNHATTTAMTARRPLQPVSPLVGNANGAIYNHTKAENEYNEANGAEEYVRDDQSQGSIVSGLTNMEEDADEFERQMIQNARDERRLNSLAQGSSRVVPFRKARIRPGVALTMDNLERNERNGRDDGVVKAHVKFESPASSNGSRSESVRSDPAIQPPAAWGRKSRKQRDWLRTITSGDEQEAGAQDDTVERLVDDDMPVDSVEDSPLSRKGSLAGTPSSTRRRDAQLDQVHDWGGDFTMEFNEASMIASTPYIPRNNMLEIIRTREIESLKEQAVTTNRLDKIRETSPGATRRRRSSSALSTNNQTNAVTAVEQPVPKLSASELRRKRTNSWKTIGRSQAVTGEGSNQLANSPVLVYKKSSETIGIINRDLVANAPTSPKRPAHRREDSHDLLRRLARVSNTPSPGRSFNSRPQTAPATQLGGSSQAINIETTVPNSMNAQPPEKTIQESTSVETVVAAPSTLPQENQADEKPQPQDSLPTPSPEPETADIDATPMPIERSMLSAKTPQVMGGWIETPAPALRISRRPTSPSRSLSRSPQRASPSKRSPQKQSQIQPQPQPEEAPPAPLKIHKPTLPGSALSSIISHAKFSTRRQRSDDLGDSTINSLEDLITPGNSNSEVEEDTLQGLQIPTEVPKNEAERERQQEVKQLLGMNQRLRAARISIRDASRGMKRVEDQVEHFGEGQDEGVGKDGVKVAEDGVRVVYKDCPCAGAGHHTSPKPQIKSFFRNPKSKWWGLTWLSLFLIGFFIWFITENVAWYAFLFPIFPLLTCT